MLMLGARLTHRTYFNVRRTMSHLDATDEDDGDLALFAEPDDYFKPEPTPTTAVHRLRSGQDISVRLVGHNPLWGHFLWNAGRCIADFLEDNAAELVEGRTVLELGAGGGLPSLVAALRGARAVVVTDYPDADLIENLAHNISSCTPSSDHASIVARGYLWGASVNDLKSTFPQTGSGFDLLILADLLFNHSEHHKLVSSIQQTLHRSRNAQALVFFTPYRPWLLQKDLAFFDVAKEGGFAVEKMFEHVMDKVMFDNDPGDELLRRTVFGYRLKWSDSEIDAS